MRAGGCLVARPAREADSGAVLFFAVPALLLVVLGYAVGYAVIDWLAGVTGAELPASAPEVGGWIAGLLLTVAVTVVLLRARRSRRAGGRQK